MAYGALPREIIIVRLRRWPSKSALILPLLSSALVITTPGIAKGTDDTPRGSFQQPVIDVKQQAEHVEFTVRMIPERQRTRSPPAHPVHRRDIQPHRGARPRHTP